VVEVGWGVVDATAAAAYETKMEMANPLRMAREAPLLIIALIGGCTQGPEGSDNEVDFQFYRGAIDVYENVPRVQVTTGII
jgi:hypothetical protein